MEGHSAKSHHTRFVHWIRIRPHLLAGLLFFTLTVGMTWPLITRLNTHITPGQQPTLTVPYFNLWALARNHQWLSGEIPSYWDANIFYPHKKTLAYSEPQLAIGLLTAPLVFSGSNTIFAYNTALLSFFWSAGMTAYALCWWLLGTCKKDSRNEVRTKTFQRSRWLSAVTAGILYGFNFYMFREIGVLQLLATFFLPLTFLGIHRFFHQHRWSDALLFGVSFLGCWYACAYYGLFLSVFVLCFVIRFWHRDVFSKSSLTRIMVVLVFIVVCLMPLVYGMWSAKKVMGFDRSEFIVQNLSAAFMEYLRFPHHSWLYGGILEVGSGKSLFFGWGMLCLSSFGVVAIFRSKYNRIVATNEQTQSLLQQYGAFYLLMALLAFLLSLGMAFAPGPSMDLGGYKILVWLSPYNLLYKFVPGFSSIRSPHRFSLFCFLFLAILAGYGVFLFSQRVRPRWRQILVPFLITMVIFELWPLPLRLVKITGNVEEIPRIYQHVRKLAPDSVLIELPIVMSGSEKSLETDARYMYLSTFHRHALVNGYSGFAPQACIELVDVILRSTPQVVFSGLKAFDVQYILAHTDELTESEKVQLQQLEAKGLKRLFTEGNDFLYQVDYGTLEPLNPLLDITEIAIYESQTSQNQVSLCLYYQIDDQQCRLITPWHNRIEYEIAWYKHPKLKKGDSKPVLVSHAPYRGSKLITADSNALEIDIPSPPPGEYQVIVRQRFASNFKELSLLCQVHSNGFVTFQREK